MFEVNISRKGVKTSSDVQTLVVASGMGLEGSIMYFDFNCRARFFAALAPPAVVPWLFNGYPAYTARLDWAVLPPPFCLSSPAVRDGFLLLDERHAIWPFLRLRPGTDVSSRDFRLFPAFYFLLEETLFSYVAIKATSTTFSLSFSASPSFSCYSFS